MTICSLMIFISFLFVHAIASSAGPRVETSDLNRPPPTAPQTQGAAAFQQSLERIGKAAGSAGVLVVSLPSGEAVFESRPKDLFVPASLMKLLTSYAALKRLGPSFRFTTGVLAAEDPVGGVVSGDIWIKGSGDPFFTSDGAVELAKSIREKGIRQIRGGIFVDNSFFELSSERVCLDSDCVGVYNPIVSAAAIDFNTVRVKITVQAKTGSVISVNSDMAQGYVRVSGKVGRAKKAGGPVRLRSLGAAGNGQEQFELSGCARRSRVLEFRVNAGDPAGLFAHALRTALERSGVRVLGASAKEGKTPPGARTIVSYDSPPLAEFLCGLNKYSNNFMAEMLLRSLGGYAAGAPGNSDKGLAVVRSTLGQVGIPDEIAALDCGSGLSRFCRISPQTLCRLLAAAWNDDGIKEDFISSLAVNGEKGTLMRRMHKPGLTVKGKTGTLNDVIGFAGYVSGPSGKTFAVAIILNEVRDRFKARQALDSVLEQVAFSSS